MILSRSRNIKQWRNAKGKKGKTTRNGSKRDKGKRESTLKDFKA
jgi:hypothetical protein